jgi:Flp pilus assembly protein TadB
MKETFTLLIPIIAIVMGCGIPLLYIFLDYRKRRELFTNYHRERMAAIDRGIELPPLPDSFFKNDFQGDQPARPHSDLGWGLFWLLGGLAMLAAMYFNGKGTRSLYALIAVAIGVHYLIYYFAVGRKAALLGEATARQVMSDK